MPKKKSPSRPEIRAIASLVPAKKEQEMVWLDHDQGPTYYSNTIEVVGSLWDVRLRIGEIVNADDSQLVMREKAKVFLSPQHAVVLAEILEKNIKRYEELFGPIPRRPGKA